MGRVVALLSLAATLSLPTCPALSYDVLPWEQRSENLLSNGGFEADGAEGQLAADWVGFRDPKTEGGVCEVQRVPDAHSGQHAVRLKAEGESIAGLNRAYIAGKDGGAMLPQVRRRWCLEHVPAVAGPASTLRVVSC